MAALVRILTVSVVLSVLLSVAGSPAPGVAAAGSVTGTQDGPAQMALVTKNLTSMPLAFTENQGILQMRGS